jgi:hypothetical protein
MDTFKRICIHTFVLGFLCIPLVLHAQSPKIDNPLKNADDLSGLVVALLNNVVMPIAAVASVLYIIYAGFLYVQAQGKPAEIQKAHQNLLWALIGIGVLLGAAGISQVVQNTVKSLTN